MLLVLYFIAPYQQPKKVLSSYKSSSSSSKVIPATTITHRHQHRTLLLISCGVLFAVYYSAENNYIPYSTAMWQSLPVHLSAEEANRVSSVLSIFYTIGPLVTSLISIRLMPDIIILYHYAIMLIALLFLFFGQRNIKLIYVGSAIIGNNFSLINYYTY